jgi:putative sigma-54 modulation protein
MELQITGKNIELTPELRRYIERKLGKLDRHLPGIREVKVEIAEQKTKSPLQRFIAQVTAESSGIFLRGEERGDDLLNAFDRAATVMDRQVERYKGKRHSKKGSASPRTIAALSADETQTNQLVKKKQFKVKLMSADEAIEQMELLSHDFFLFLNNENGKLNLVYRRKDKNYGLIEPGLD